MPPEEDRDWQRLDTWLWSARFLKARSDCQRLIAEGMVRINRQPTDKAHARLRLGNPAGRARLALVGKPSHISRPATGPSGPGDAAFTRGRRFVLPHDRRWR